MSLFRRIAASSCVFLVAACTTKATMTASPAPSHAATHTRLVGKTTLRIGVKVDNPGLGEVINREPVDRQGFEIDVAMYVAHGLGARKVEWHDVFPKDRISVLETGKVDLVVAAFAISANRLDKVAFAGPYIISGQDILIRSSDVGVIDGLSSLKDRKVCSIVGSTSVERLVQEFGKAWDTPAHLVRVEGTRQCINMLLAGDVDAVSSGNMILAGYAAEQPDRLHLVGHPFTVDNVGIGLARSDA